MNDDELSLAIAKIMWPQYEWNIDKGDVFAWPLKGEGGYDGIHDFKYTTDDALGKMCVWLATWIDGNESECNNPLKVHLLLLEENPHEAIAEAIVETSK